MNDGCYGSVVGDEPQQEPPTPTGDWLPTHYSVRDGSAVRLVRATPFTVENEDGDRWEDDPDAWIPVAARRAWAEKRTVGAVIDGIYLPANACGRCGKWFPPYKAGVPAEHVGSYCWGDCA